ncbi:Winged helix-turn-helix transcription repressor DNA-binding [Penicillium taxi]|uniref:Winged helix-turn-helix transcription repressor DNA-binding n=1 Tax=Penicillium taxi TaxID=168475 RepID=UPI0025459773|nr:Winged helix-turn-helix transcription repressor DNA-binding [Penicillium taxi]KAJ5908911.1 Winged helix-turn-helix transcription repressor DNA-binding [Penicillium taxi]
MALDILGEEPVSLVRAYIDNTLTVLVHELSLSPSEARPSVTLRRRTNAAACTINPNNGALESAEQEESYRKYSWPGNTVAESWKFTMVVRILSIIDQAIRTGQLISKRSQKVVDEILDDLAYTIGVDRAALNVEATAKGLIVGPFRLRRDGYTVVDARLATTETLIPRIQNGDDIDIAGARWVLIVEKEAAFHRLVRNSFHMTAFVGEGILITGKGYPDISTRSLVRRVFDMTQNARYRPRFYALVDGDPDGIAIMSTYKHGSIRHMHENASLTIPELEWLGMRVSDAATIPESSDSGVFLSLTARDRRKIISMLQNSPVFASGGPELEWRLELQRMLMLNVKLEIEAVYEQSGGLEAWINRKMFRQE